MPAVIALHAQIPVESSQRPFPEHNRSSLVVGDVSLCTVVPLASMSQRAPAAWPIVDANVTVAVVPPSACAAPVMPTGAPNAPLFTEVCAPLPRECWYVCACSHAAPAWQPARAAAVRTMNVFGVDVSSSICTTKVVGVDDHEPPTVIASDKSVNPQDIAPSTAPRGRARSAPLMDRNTTTTQSHGRLLCARGYAPFCVVPDMSHVNIAVGGLPSCWKRLFMTTLANESTMT